MASKDVQNIVGKTVAAVGSVRREESGGEFIGSHDRVTITFTDGSALTVLSRDAEHYHSWIEIVKAPDSGD